MTQAPIEPHHKDDAANILSQSYDRILTIAQTLANDEAKAKALAEIDRCLVEQGWAQFNKAAAIAAPYRASDPTPDQPASYKCKFGCERDAIKDEFEAFRREVSDAAVGLIRMTEESCTTLWQGVTREALSRFIIPAIDPVAEALREALTGANLLTYSELAEHFSEVFATHGLEIVERRDR